MVKAASATERVLRYYRQNILSGTWQVGEKIPSEHQLAQALQVSRASIRTATRQLIGIGILESYQGKGTYLVKNQAEGIGTSLITSQDCMDAHDVLEFRQIVEPEACFRAAQYADEAMVNELSGYLEAMISYMYDREIFVDADVSFHQCICRGTRNALLERSMCRILEETRENQRITYSIDNLKNPIYYHTLILNAIKTGDGAQAREYMKQHLQSTINLLDNRLAEENP